jgi:hypothetical protein
LLLLMFSHKKEPSSANKVTLMDGCQLYWHSFPISVACHTQKCHSLNHLHSQSSNQLTHGSHRQINHSYFTTVILGVERDEDEHVQVDFIDDDGRRKLIRYWLVDVWEKNKVNN